MSDLNDRWPADDADVIAVSNDVTAIGRLATPIVALVPIDLTRVERVADADRGGVDDGAGDNPPAPPSSGSRDLALNGDV